MKTILRIFVILLAVMVVVGGTYAYGQTAAATEQVGQGLGGSNGRGGEGEGSGRGPGRGRQAEADGNGGELGIHDRDRLRSEEGFDLAAMADFGRTLLPMALVIAGVVLFSWLFELVRKRKKKQATPPDTPVSTA